MQANSPNNIQVQKYKENVVVAYLMKLEIWYFLRCSRSGRVVMAKKCTKKYAVYVQNCCYARLSRFLFIRSSVAVDVRSLDLKGPINLGAPADPQSLHSPSINELNSVIKQKKKRIQLMNFG